MAVILVIFASLAGVFAGLGHVMFLGGGALQGVVTYGVTAGGVVLCGLVWSLARPDKARQAEQDAHAGIMSEETERLLDDMWVRVMSENGDAAAEDGQDQTRRSA